jgi:hypothetical protein
MRVTRRLIEVDPDHRADYLQSLLLNQIEAGNIALVAAVPESAPLNSPCATAGAQGTAAYVVTNSQGRARVCVSTRARTKFRA